MGVAHGIRKPRDPHFGDYEVRVAGKVAEVAMTRDEADGIAIDLAWTTGGEVEVWPIRCAAL